MILKGWEKDKAVRALESSGFHAKNGLRVLEQKSLITTTTYNRLHMHDHIEEMGKNIVRRLHPNKPHNHSRLWIKEEIEDVLVGNLVRFKWICEGTEATRSITFKSWNMELNPTTIMKGLVNMKELSFLEVRDYKEDLVLNVREFDEDSQDLPNVLRTLSWYGYPFTCLPIKFRVHNPAGLETSDNSIIQLWEPGERKVLEELRFIELNNSMLRRLDLRLIPNLETLILQNCDDLEELDMRFGCQKLKFLDLSGSKLRALYLGPTPNLEVLKLENCNYLVQLQMHGERLKLKSLQLSGSKLRGLDLGPTPNLELLELRDYNLVEFHMHSQSLTLKSLALFLPQLRTLNLAQTTKLIKSLKLCLHGSVLRTLDLMRSPNLETLWVKGFCKLEELGSFQISICNLRCLRGLELEGSFPELPTDLHLLECLEELVLSNANILHLPNTICMLKHLKVLRLEGCDLLEQLPEDFGRLESLEKLTLLCKKIEHLPHSICMLKHMKVFKLEGCHLLQQLPEDLGRLESLEKLSVSCKKIEHLPHSICKLKHLKILSLYNCELLEQLPEDLGRLECLEQLNLYGCLRLRDLPNSICEMKHLKNIDASYCLVEKLPVDCLKKLNINEGSAFFAQHKTEFLDIQEIIKYHSLMSFRVDEM